MDSDRPPSQEPSSGPPLPPGGGMAPPGPGVDPGLLQYEPKRAAPRPPVGAQGSFRLFRVLGITVFLHWSWFLVAVYEIRDAQGTYSNIAWNVAEYLGLFVIVLLHEFGHSLACRSVGGRAEKIVLWPLGGLAYVQPPPRPGATLWSIAAGPLVNVVLLPVLFGAMHFIGPTLPFDARQLLRHIAAINLILLVFNILPIYPLDGGQILQSLLWFVVGRGRSLQIAAIIGILGAAAGAAYALYIGSLWTGALALFVGSQAYNGIRVSKMLLTRQNAPRRAGARCPECGANPPLGPHWACACGNHFDTFESGGICSRCGRMYGMTACLDCGKASPRQQWSPVQYTPFPATHTPMV